MARPPLGRSSKTHRLEIRLNDDDVQVLDALRGSSSRCAYLMRLLYDAARLRNPERSPFQELEAQDQEQDPVLVARPLPDPDVLVLLAGINRSHPS